MVKDCVNAMFESLQTSESRVNCSELFGLVINVSLLTFANFYFISTCSRCCLAFRPNNLKNYVACLQNSQLLFSFFMV